MRAKPEKTVVKEYPETCVVSLDFTPQQLNTLKKMAKKNKMTIDELCNEALRLMIYPTQNK